MKFKRQKTVSKRKRYDETNLWIILHTRLHIQYIYFERCQSFSLHKEAPEGRREGGVGGGGRGANCIFNITLKIMVLSITR